MGENKTMGFFKKNNRLKKRIKKIQSKGTLTPKGRCLKEYFGFLISLDYGYPETPIEAYEEVISHLISETNASRKEIIDFCYMLFSGMRDEYETD